MKAHFKYIFRAELMRLIVFAVILAVNLVFVVLSAFGVLPLAARIVAVSLSGSAISVMFIFNIIGDVSIINRLFSPRNAVIYALTPSPRKNRLIASIISMTIMDFVTMTVSILGVVFLGLNLGSYWTGNSISEMLWWGSYSYYGFSYYGFFDVLSSIILPFALLLGGYLYLITLIVFCKAVRKSVLYNKPAGGFLAFLVAVGILYITNIATFLIAPFGHISRFFTFFVIDVGRLGIGMYTLLMFIIVAVMFVLTARLMERKINI